MTQVTHSLLEPFHLLVESFVEDSVRPFRSPEEGILVGVGAPLPGWVHKSWCLQPAGLQLGLVLKPGAREPWTPYRIVSAFVQAGVPAGMLSAAGAAEFDPIAPNDTTENKAMNRRVELVFVPKIDELPGFDQVIGGS